MKVVKKSLLVCSLPTMLTLHTLACVIVDNPIAARAATSKSSTSAPNVPPDAIVVDSIQILSSWEAGHDSGTSGSSTGQTSIVSSPSISGSAREFATQFTGNGGERYAVSFGEDTSSTNFLYDGWIYLKGSSSSIANLEMDVNQVMANGQNATFGFQCDGWNGTWDYTSNAGTPESPIPQWVRSQQACNPRKWSTNTWHHIQIAYSRDDSGNVTYQSVWLDGNQQTINATVPSAFALGWATVLQTQFQVDGYGSSGSSTVYLDNLNVYRWSNASTSDLIPNGTYVLTSVLSGLALDDTNYSDSEGMHMQLWGLSNGVNQQWMINNLGQNVITMTNVESGMLLDVAGASTSNSAAIDQWPEDGQTDQQWKVTAVGSGAFELTNVKSGLAVEVSGAGKTNGAAIDQYPYQDNPWQQWIFQAP